MLLPFERKDKKGKEKKDAKSFGTSIYTSADTIPTSILQQRNTHKSFKCKSRGFYLRSYIIFSEDDTPCAY